MGYSILIVDDSPIIRKMTRRTLGLAKLPVGSVFEAANGREALEILRDEWIDVVLADIHMPEMTGMELIERMAKDEVMGKIPVVVISAERSEPAIAHLKSLGICGHLVKPFTPEQILESVTQVIDEVAKRSHA